MKNIYIYFIVATLFIPTTSYGRIFSVCNNTNSTYEITVIPHGKSTRHQTYQMGPGLTAKHVAMWGFNNSMEVRLWQLGVYDNHVQDACYVIHSDKTVEKINSSGKTWCSMNTTGCEKKLYGDERRLK